MTVLLLGLLLLLLGAGSAQAMTVTVPTKTSTQLVIKYPAPSASACTVEVSESATYAPLAHDVNSALFAGANLDTRTGSLGVGSSSRVFVAGTRIVAVALNSNNYSRALQANTLHYIRVTCGADNGTTTATTMNPPRGNTRGETFIRSSTAGTTLWPTLDDTDRTQTVIDPWTGVLLKRVGLPADVTPDTFLEDSEWAYSNCSALSSNGFFRCAWTVSGGNANHLYAIKPTTGEVRYLGQLWFFASTYSLGTGLRACTFPMHWHATDPDVLYCPTFDNTSGTKQRLFKGTYTGNDVAVSAGTFFAMTMTDLTAGSDFVALMAAYTGTFDAAKFNACTVFSVQSHYALLTCPRGPAAGVQSQDTYGWLAAYDLDTTSIIGALKVWEQTGTRWCMIHSQYTVGEQAVANLFPQTPKGVIAAGNGPYAMKLQTTMVSTSSDTTIDVTSTCPGGFGSCVTGDPVGPNPDEWLMSAAVGDTFQIGTEWVRLKTRNSNTQWVVERGYVTGITAAHAINDDISARCNAFPGAPNDDPEATGDIYWKFLTGAYGIRTSSTGTHDSARPGYWLNATYAVVLGDMTDAATWTAAPNMLIRTSPAFAGIRAEDGGNTYQKHPTYHQTAATGAEKDWFADMSGVSGGTTFSNSAATTVETDLYKYVSALTLHRKQQPTFGFAGDKILRDISGPSSHITNGSGDNYTYCVAAAIGECRGSGDAGGISAVGDIFINAPGVNAALGCASSTSQSWPSGSRDLCVGDMSSRGQVLNQFVISDGVSGSTADAYVRPLVRTFMPWRLLSIGASARILPDASWILTPVWPYGTATETLMMAKVPPVPTPDGLDRTGFLALPVTIAAPTLPGATHAVVEFGYAEEGDPSSHYCTSRADICTADSASLSQSAPFKFKSVEPSTGLACASGCTIIVPSLPQRVVYWKIRYLDNAGVYLSMGDSGSGSGTVGVALDPPAPGKRGHCTHKHGVTICEERWLKRLVELQS